MTNSKENSDNDSLINNKPKITQKYQKELKNQLINGKSYILINNRFYGKICNRKIDHNLYKISYKISKDYLVLYPNQAEV